MADDTQDPNANQDVPQPPQAVTVTGNRYNNNDAKLSGLTPLQAGLLYGGAASTVLGPVGALVGLGAGIITKIQRDTLIDHRAKQVSDVVSETQGLQAQAKDMMANADDPTRKFLEQQMRLASEGMTQFINEADPQGRAKMENANIALAGVLSAQMQQQRESANAQETAKRTLVSNEAELYRNQFQSNQDNFRSINTQADKILDLTSAKDFNPNKAVNKGLIVGMLTTGVGLYRDNPADYTDAVTQGVEGLKNIPGVGGVIGGVAGPVIGGIMTAIKGKDFQLSTQDYNRLALNMKNFAAKDAQQKSAQLSQQSQHLDMQARKWGVFDEKTDLAGYITGGVKELPVTKAPELPPAPTASDLLPSTSQSPNRQPVVAATPRYTGAMAGRGLQRWGSTDQTAAIQTNIAQGLSESQARPTN